MRNTSIWSLLTMSVLSALLLFGCSEERSLNAGDTETAADQTVDLDAPNGGFLAVDEAPAFGDVVLEASADKEERVQDGYAGLGQEQHRQLALLEEDPERVWYCSV